VPYKLRDATPKSSVHGTPQPRRTAPGAALTSRSNMSVEHGIVTCARSGARERRRRVGTPDIEEPVGCQCRYEAAWASPLEYSAIAVGRGLPFADLHGGPLSLSLPIVAPAARATALVSCHHKALKVAARAARRRTRIARQGLRLFDYALPPAAGVRALSAMSAPRRRSAGRLVTTRAQGGRAASPARRW
jgi:hypothetical protein